MTSAIGSFGAMGGQALSMMRHNQVPQQAFGKMDASEDGKLDLAEITSALENGPLGFNADQASARAGKMLGKLDTDGDGALSQGEFKSPFEMMGDGTKAALLGAQEFGGGFPGGVEPPSLEELFAAGDEDESGGLNEDEFAQFLAGRSPFGGRGAGSGPDLDGLFGRADSDGDGELTQAEMEAARENARTPGGLQRLGGLADGQGRSFDFADQSAAAMLTQNLGILSSQLTTDTLLSLLDNR